MPATIDRVVVLTTLPNEMEAGLVVAALDEAGVAATITGDMTSGFRVEAPGRVQVNIADADQERALNVLRQIEQERGSFDWSQAESADDATEDDTPPSTGIGSLRLWRRLAQMLIALYFIWVAVVTARGIARVLFDWRGGFF